MRKLFKRHEQLVRQVNEEKEPNEKEKGNTNPPDSENEKLHAKEERTKRKNDRTEIRKKILKNQLYRKMKKHLQRSLQQKNNETSSLQKLAENQQNLVNGYFEGTEKHDNETNKGILGILKKYKRNFLKRITRAETEHSHEPKLRDINKAMTLISKIEALLRLERKVTSNDIKDGTRSKEDTVVGKFNDKFGEPRIEEIEKYINTLHDLLTDNKLTTKNVKNNQIPVHESLTTENRHKRDLSERSDNPRKDILLKRSRADDLKNHIRRKMRRRNDDRKETSLVASDLGNFDNRKNIVQDLLRQYRSRRFLRANGHRGDPQLSVFNIQDHGRATRDVNSILTEVGGRRDSILRKRSKIDDVRDHVNERKSRRKDDFKREGLLSPLNPRITGSGESGFRGFHRRDSIGEFPKGDIFITTGNSDERNDQDYDYVEDDEDD